MKISSGIFGKSSKGETINCWILENENGMSAEIISYGGAIRALNVPVRGKMRDLVLGFDDAAGYEEQTAYIGALIGRVANRIGGAGFSLDGQSYELCKNDGENCLHGGTQGFHTKNWLGSVEDGRLVLRLESPHGEGGFPGKLSVSVSYFLSEDNAFCIEYNAESDAKTPISLTNHTYFNLDGNGSIENHQVQIFADYITEIDEALIPTGRLMSVGGTVLDLRGGRVLKEGLEKSHPQMEIAGGYDHNYVLSRNGTESLCPAAVVKTADLCMECSTTQPGLQLYSGNSLGEIHGKRGTRYGKRAGLCLETQGIPNSVNKPDFLSIILNPDEIYSHKTVYRFKEI